MDQLSNCQQSLMSFYMRFFDRSRFGIQSSQIFLILILFLGLIISSNKAFSQGLAPISIPKGGFAIDGNLIANSPANTGDWFPGGVGTGEGVYKLVPVGEPINPIFTFRFSDPFDSNTDEGFSGSKSSDSPTDWKWANSKSTGKSDIGNVFLHIGSDPNTNDDWLVVGSDRFTVQGTSYLEFEFFQNDVYRKPDGTFFTAGPNAGRTENDVLISISYTNGGSTATIEVFVWKQINGVWQYQLQTNVLGSDAYGAVNSISVPSPIGAFGNANYAPYQFVEAAINISKIVASSTACQGVSVRKMMVKTRASASLTAAAVDFLDPVEVKINFGTATISYDPNKFCGPNNLVPVSLIGVQNGTYSAPNGLSIDPTTGEINLALSTAGTYLVRYDFVTANCPSFTTTSVTIPTKAPTPQPAEFNFCQGSGNQLLSITPNSGYTLKWYNSNDVLLPNNGAAPTISTAQAGTSTFFIRQFKNGECDSERAEVTVIVNQAPAAPVSGGDQTGCEANPNPTLTATATVPQGFSVVWYTAATGGSEVANPTRNSVGTVTYYAEAVNNTTACKSLTRTPVTLTITAAPAAPVSGGDQTECEANPIQTLTATATVPQGFSVVWYDQATGGSVVANPTRNSVGTVTYYAEAVNNTTTCKSLTRTPVTLKINAAPAAPQSGGNQTICEGDAPSITATATVPQGFSVVWYDQATGGSVVANPTRNSVGTVTYYAEAVNNTTSCKSLTRTPVILTINAAPAKPVSGGNQVECLEDPIQTLTATATVPQGFSVVWYDQAAGGSVVADPSWSTVGTKTYYAESVNNTTDCKSLTRTAVSLTILNAPIPPQSGGDITICEGDEAVITATATGPGTIVWYDQAEDGKIVVDPSLSQVGTVTYFAQSEGSSCSSLERTPVTLTILQAPVAPVSGGNQTICEGDAESITATATVPQGFSVVWYTVAIGGNVVANPSLSTVGSVTYYAEAINNETNCKSLTRTPVTLTILGAPVAPVSGGDQTICEGDAQSITASATVPQGFSVVWYTAAIGGNVVANPSLSTVGSITYYAGAVNNETDCSSLTRTAVTLIINAAPVPPVSGGNQTICEGDAQSITATATVPQGFSVVWYTAAIGGNVVANPSLSIVGSITYYAEAVNNETNCKSLSRTAVTLTINPAPVVPVSGGSQVQCLEDPIQTLTATATVPQGFSMVWYNQAVGGSVVQNPTLNSVGTVTYYAEAVNNETNCKSLARTAVSLTILDAPAPPQSEGNITICEGDQEVITASAVGPGTIVWYDAPVGGNVVANPSLSTVGSITYYAQSIGSSCSSLNRTGVTLTILPAPVAPVSGGNQTECFLEQGQVLTATASVPEGFNIIWYDASAGGNVVANPTLSAVGSVTYYAEAVNASTECRSLGRTPVTLTFNTCSLEIEKTASVLSVNNAGDVINYTLVVSNKGSATITNVVVTDPLTGLIQNINSILPGATQNINTQYVVTQADVDNGSIVNVATATGFVGEVQVSSQDEAVVTAIQNPSISVEITDNNVVITAPDQEIPYTIVVTNTGNVTLENVTVVDTQTGLVINVGTLAPGESKTIETVYTVTQEDVDKGEVTNETTATGDSPNQGDDNPTDNDDVTTPILPDASISIVKTADKNEISVLGELVSYSLTVTNTGNVTLYNVTVSDPLTGLQEGLEELAPEEQVVFETSYVVTQADLDRGTLTNVAMVSGETPTGEKVESEDGVTVGVFVRKIIANDDEFGSYFLRYGGLIGNILDNDLLDGQRPDPADVDFEFTDLDGIIGLLINDNGELSLIPGVNEIREYRLRYVLRETANPSNSDEGFVFFRILNNDANLSVTKVALSDDIFEGDVFTYQIVVRNIGQTDATNVVVTDNIPSGVTYQSFTVVNNTTGSTVTPTINGNNVSFAIPFMAKGTAVTININVKAGAAGTVTNTVIVASSEDDTDESNNQATDVSEIKEFRIPNVITPNGDGKNDTFEIQGLNKFVTNKLTIFNRYGDHVLVENNYQNDWTAPGQFGGTYFYVLQVTNASGNVIDFTGWIQVIKD